MNVANLAQGVANAAYANITQAVSSPEILAEAQQALAILQLLGIMNVGKLGFLATLTDLATVQQAVQAISAHDLLATVAVLQGESGAYNTAPPALMTNVIGFIATIEMLLPQVTDIRAATAYVILQQLGLTSVMSGLGS